MDNNAPQDFLDDLERLCKYYDFILENYTIELGREVMQYDTFYQSETVPINQSKRIDIKILVP